MMKNFRNYFFGLVLISLAATPAQAAEVKVVEANGVKAWVVEDHILPIIAIELAFKGAGSAHDPDGKEGLGYATASMLNEGAGEYESQEYQKLLEENAIGFSPDLDKDNFSLTLKTLTPNLDLALDLTDIALNRPRFAENDLARIKSQTVTIIKKKRENPAEIASEEFAKAIFGSHPYAKLQEGTVNSLERISAADLHHFAKSNFARDNIIISIVGDVDEESAKNIITRLTANLPEKSATSQLPDFKTYPKTIMAKFKMANPQTYVVFGEEGIDRRDKDYYAAYILNHVLGGGGFSARLMTEVREKKGLAYGVGTELQVYDKANLLAGVVSTKNESVDKSINIIKQELAKIAEKGINADELKDAKDYITGSFGLNLDKNENLAGFLISMQLYDLGPDYLQKRNDYFKTVTLHQVNELARRLIRPENLVFVRVGH